MRIYPAVVVSVLLAELIGPFSGTAAEIEKPSALNGSLYTVIAPVYDGTTGAQSYVRLYNGGTAASSFAVTVLSTTNGFTLGGANIQVPANASIQYPLTPTGGSNSIFTQTGVGTSGGSYALYIQDSDTLAGYQHVTYNGTTNLFENNSVCTTPINQQMASSNKQVLTNVHTTKLSSYPANIVIHNYAATSTTVTITAYDAVTGLNIGQTNQAIAANTTLTLAESQLETLLTFSPTSAQQQINVVVTNAAGGTLPVSIAESVRNAQLGGDINMAETCAVNAVAPGAISVPVTYCGTLKLPFPYNALTINLTADVSSAGKFGATYYGESGGISQGGQLGGTVTGTSFTATTSSGGSASGTVQNGSVIGTLTLPSLNGIGTISASQNGCS